MTSEHFAGKYEAELKFHLSDPDAFLKRITLAGAEPFHLNNREIDCYYERPTSEHSDSTLKKSGISMCIREMQPSGIKLWIVKGPDASECEAINIDDCEKVASMVEKLGFQPSLRMEKNRSIYFLGRYHITFDHLPTLGYFAEIAIMTDDEHAVPDLLNDLRHQALALGLEDSQREMRSYRQMLEQTRSGIN